MLLTSMESVKSPLGSLARTLLLNRILSECDPILPRLSYLSGQVGVITKTLRQTAHDQLASFATPKGRSDFLVAAHKHLSGISTHEELIAAFGRTLGQRLRASSRLTHVWRGVGDAQSVRFTPRLIQLINDQAMLPDGEVLLVHNHPQHALKSVLDYFGLWRPIPSSQDRNVALAYTIGSLQRQTLGGPIARVRWFLVDQGELAEFRLPSIEWIASMVRDASK